MACYNLRESRPAALAPTPGRIPHTKADSMIPDPLDAVIFDMDGVVLDTERLYRTALCAACTEQGQAMPDRLYLTLIGIPKEAGAALLHAHFGGGLDLDRLEQACEAHFAALCPSGVPLRPGVERLLRYLRGAGIPRGIATSTARRTAEAQLRAAGVLDWFDVVVTRDDVVNGKPHPEPFLKAAAALGARPAQCLALEDSYNGIRSAAAAGMATVMVPDLLPPTAEMRRLCKEVAPDLATVHVWLAARPVSAAPGHAMRPATRNS